jgi:hypothetical protein
MPLKALDSDPSAINPQNELAKIGKGQKTQETMEAKPQQVRLPIRGNSLVIRIERLGQTDVLNLRRGNELGVVVISVDTYEYRKEVENEGSRPIPFPVKIDQTRYISHDKDLSIDMPIYFAERKLIDIEIPASLDPTVIIDNEIRYKGTLEDPKAWKGFEPLEGTITYSAAKKQFLFVRELHPELALPLNQYPFTGGQNVKIAKKFDLPSPFRGLQSIFVQVDSVTHNPVSVLIPGLATNDIANQRLLEHVGSWEIIDQETRPGVKGFTTGLQINKRREGK